jgi:hypothetical protein
MSGDRETRIRISPHLGRRWNTDRSRWTVVLKRSQPRWATGAVLLAELPVCTTAPTESPQQRARVVADSKMDAIATLLYEFLLHCRFCAKNPPTDTAAKKASISSVVETLTANDRQEAEPAAAAAGADAKTPSDVQFGPARPPTDHLWPSTTEEDLSKWIPVAVATLRCRYNFSVDDATAEAAKAAVARYAVPIIGFFTEKQEGLGLYPMLAHVRPGDSEVSSDINACVIFQETTRAMVIALRNIEPGEEIVLAPLAGGSGPLGQHPTCVGAKCRCTFTLESVIRTVREYQSHSSLGCIPNLIRAQFVMLDLKYAGLQSFQPPPGPAENASDFWKKMGIDPYDAPAAKAPEQLTPREWALYHDVQSIAGGRVGLYELLAALKDDATAVRYHKLWFAKGGLESQWNTISKRLSAPTASD